MKIGVFGGTFNPPHLGHKIICREFSDHIGFDRLLIIPTYTPPHKSDAELIPCEKRLEMCRICFSDFENCEISTVEIDRKGKSYTYDTLKELKKIYPDSEIYFIMGSDMLKTFNEWYHPEGILSLCKICAAERSGEDSLEDYRDKIIYLPIKPFEISSTEIRRKVKNHEKIVNYVGREVAEYIEKEGLYRDL